MTDPTGDALKAAMQPVPAAWHRSDTFVFHFSLGPMRPPNNTSDPEEWRPLYAAPAPRPHLRGSQDGE